MGVPIIASEDSPRTRSCAGTTLVRRAILVVLFGVHCFLRLSGLGWNIAHHSAFPTSGVPTYHVDEMLLAQGLRSDFRLFSAYSLVVDGPLSLNLTYLPLAVLGENPPERWNAAAALLAGRGVAAIADCLAFPALWALLAELGIGFWPSLFAGAVLAFSPNHVLNAHFARSHTVANLLQLVVLLATAKAIGAGLWSRRVFWFALSAFSAVLAGAARYPFLTLGLFPAVAAIALLMRALRARTCAPEIASLAGAGGAAVLLGLLLGFDLRPIEMLRKAIIYQSAVGQLPWGELHAIAGSAAAKVRSMIDFPSGAARALLFLACPLALLPGVRRRSAASLVAPSLAAWAVLYLLLWAKFMVPWQRYSIPLSMALVVLGTMGIDRAVSWVQGRVAVQYMAALRLCALAAAVFVLAPPAYLSGLIAARFVTDQANPLYELSLRLKGDSWASKRQVFVHQFWSWNLPLLQVIPPEQFALQFVPSLEAACARASEGDLVLDLVFEPLRGACPSLRLMPIFHASNLGPAGFPFPTHHSTAPGLSRHYEDYHYLFEDVTLFRVMRPTPPVIGKPSVHQ